MDNKALLKRAMDDLGIEDNDERAMLAAICMGESALDSKAELGYAHTSNERIRAIFSRTRTLSTDELNNLKASPKAFFNYVYGGRLGNAPGTNDGYDFRGRGFIQLTGRENYEKIGENIGEDLTRDPERANDPFVAAKIACDYISDRYKGGGFQAMLDCVGHNIPDIQARKQAFYEQFSASGEFDMDPQAEPETKPEEQPVAKKGLFQRLIDLVKGR